jgi:ABC-2 type transport system ATP-binding protein
LSGGCVSSIISIKGLTKTFGAISALDGVDLEIEQGEAVGLLGPNGAGKTTLISILATILPATSGEARLCGYDVRNDPDAVRRAIGVVFQEPSLDDELTGEENLDFHGRLHGMDRQTRRKRVDEILILVDLVERRRDLVKTYSGGMRRRLEIARGLMHHPRVLFLDEPTLGLDPQTRRRIWEYIGNLNVTLRTTLILTTHYMDEADRLCSRIAVMDKGKIVALGTPDELRAVLGGDLLELELASPSDALIQALNGLEGVRRVDALAETLRLTVTHGESIIPDVVRQAHALGLDIRSIRLRKPNLEDVFIKLTGREIRDEIVTETADRVRIFMKRRKR